MDLAGMINGGAEALHRGSADRSASEESPQRSRPTSPRDNERQTRRSNRQPPVWAKVYHGRRNQVHDPRVWRLCESRPELADFTTRQAGPSNGHANGSASNGSAPNGSATNGYARHSSPAHQSNGVMPAASLDNIGPGGNISLTGLPPSIAGIVPSDDASKVLAGWVFEELAKIDDDSLLPHVEVEFKLGTIVDSVGGIRHRFPTKSESVVDPAYFQVQGLRYKTEVTVDRFKAIETLLDNLATTNAGNETLELKKENLLLRDVSYNVRIDSLGATPSRIRVTYDEHDRVLECISKQRIGDLYVSLPNSAYDLKASLAIEHPIDRAEWEPKVKDLSPVYERNKNRLAWKSQGGEVDITSVHSGSGRGQVDVKKEAEVEANSDLISSTISDYRNGSDPQSLDKFLEALRFAMDSARYITRNI